VKKVIITIEDKFVDQLVEKVRPVAENIDVEDVLFNFNWGDTETSSSDHITHAPNSTLTTAKAIPKQRKIAGVEPATDQYPQGKRRRLSSSMEFGPLVKVLSSSSYGDGLEDFVNIGHKTIEGGQPAMWITAALLIVGRPMNARELLSFIGTSPAKIYGAINSVRSTRRPFIKTSKASRHPSCGSPLVSDHYYIPEKYHKIIAARFAGEANLQTLFQRAPFEIAPDDLQMSPKHKNVTCDIQENICKHLRSVIATRKQQATTGRS